jgi:type I restriction enzyme R subunit
LVAKFDAADRQARGEPVPEDIQRLLGQLIASGDVLDVYEAAGMSKPSLDDLSPEFISKTQQARNPQLAMEAAQ